MIGREFTDATKLEGSPGQMTREQFEAMAAVCGDAPERADMQAARMVLVEGISETGAARETGVGLAVLEETLARYRRGHETIVDAYRFAS